MRIIFSSAICQILCSLYAVILLLLFRTKGYDPRLLFSNWLINYRCNANTWFTEAYMIKMLETFRYKEKRKTILTRLRLATTDQTCGFRYNSRYLNYDRKTRRWYKCKELIDEMEWRKTWYRISFEDGNCR